jgi:hypothetical protein
MNNIISGLRNKPANITLIILLPVIAYTIGSNIDIENITTDIFSYKDDSTITFSLSDTIISGQVKDKGILSSDDTLPAVSVYTRFRH